MKKSRGDPGLILWGLTLPYKEIIFRAGASIVEGAFCRAVSCTDVISLALAESPFDRAAPGQEFPFFAFSSIGKDADTFRSLVSFPHFELIAHLLAVEGGRVGYADKRILSLGVSEIRRRRGFREATTSGNEDGNDYYQYFSGHLCHKITSGEFCPVRFLYHNTELGREN